jgi:exopolysaccharide production protein ExoY
MAEHRGKIPAVMMGVGAAFDFLSGEKPQAYPWMQRLGLEWLFRLATEPRRLWYRYLYHNPRFVMLAFAQLARTFFGGVKDEQAAPSEEAELNPGMPVPTDFLDLEHSLRRKNVQLFFKRVCDFVGAALGLIALSPLFVLIALFVRLTSRGPAIFKQIRAGHNGRDFVMYKFRSMRIESDPRLEKRRQAAASQGILMKAKRDPRVTRLGAFLRSTSLDELPQLINVLKGEMSIVGPRPLIPFMLAPHPEFSRARALVRPGLAGLWQIRDRENNSNALSMMPHDLEYIRDFSSWNDAVILLKTIWVVLFRRGAW